MRVFVHGAAATPTPCSTRSRAAPTSRRCASITSHRRPLPLRRGRARRPVSSVSLFTGAPLRKADRRGAGRLHAGVPLGHPRASSPSGQVPLDVALLQLSPPDRHGNCTLGTSVDAAKAAADSARIVIAEINERMPRTHGNTVGSASPAIDAFICVDRRRFHEARHGPETDVDGAHRRARRGARRGRLDAAARASAASPTRCSPPGRQARAGRPHRDVLRRGRSISSRRASSPTGCKKVHPGRIVTSFVSGSRRLYDFVDDNLDGRVPPLRPHQRHEPHPQERQGGRHQLGGRDRPHRPGVRRLDGAHASSPASAGRWTSSAAPRSRAGARPIIALPSTAANGAGLAHRRGAQARRGRGDDPRARALGGHRARRGRTSTG